MKLFPRLIFIVAAYFITQVAISCCSDIEREFINVHNFRSQVLQNNVPVKDTAKANTAIAILLQPEFNFLSQKATLPFFNNAALALSRCPNPGESGNKNVATALEITYQGEVPLNDTIAQGAVINQYVSCRLKDFNGEHTVEQLMNLYQEERFAYNQQVTFTLKQMPVERASRVFHFKFTRADGSITEVSTQPIIW